MIDKMIDKMLAVIQRDGLTQSAVEAKAGLRPDRISDWKKVGEPKATQMLPIARALGVDVRYLLDDAIDTPIPDVSEIEAQLLEMCRFLGYETARRRLMNAPESPPTVPLPVRPPGPLPRAGLSVPGRPELHEPPREPGKPAPKKGKRNRNREA